MSESGGPPGEPVQLPIDESLDLHGIAPKDAAEALSEYLRLAREKGFARVRVIHGKGVGKMRETVHTLLRRHPDVASFAQAPAGLGHWGATLVWLRSIDAK